MNKDFSRKNSTEDFYAGLRKRIDDFTKAAPINWDWLKQPQGKTLSVIPLTGNSQSRGYLKHFRNKDYWKP